MKAGLFAALIAGSILVTAAPAAAVELNLTGNSSLYGAVGNSRTYTGAGGLTMQATAWSYAGGSAPAAAYLGAYSNGLGVTNASEGTGGNNMHAVDNAGSRDFIMLVFNQAVNVASGVLNPYAQTGSLADNDASISYANVAGVAPGSSINPSNPLFGSLASNLWNVKGNMGTGYLTDFSSSGQFGNVWLVAASFTNPDDRLDGFKLRSLNVTAAVPEPGTWAMMLLGFAAIGVTLRRSRKTGALQEA